MPRSPRFGSNTPAGPNGEKWPETPSSRVLNSGTNSSATAIEVSSPSIGSPCYAGRDALEAVAPADWNYCNHYWCVRASVLEGVFSIRHYCQIYSCLFGGGANLIGSSPRTSPPQGRKEVLALKANRNEGPVSLEWRMRGRPVRRSLFSESRGVKQQAE